MSKTAEAIIRIVGGLIVFAVTYLCLALSVFFEFDHVIRVLISLGVAVLFALFGGNLLRWIENVYWTT